MPLIQCVFTSETEEVVRHVLEQVGCKQRTQEERLWI